MSASPGPWSVEVDRANPKYFRLYDRDGQSTCRVYRWDDVGPILFAFEAFEALDSIANGFTLTPADASAILARIKQWKIDR